MIHRHARRRPAGAPRALAAAERRGPRRWRERPHALAAALLAAGLTTGCARAPLLGAVAVEPAAITPNQDGDADITRIAYAIGAPAFLTIELVGGDGTVHRLRDRRPRAPGAFAAEFGGVVDGRMLPDDTYAVRLVAEPRDGGAPATADATLRISDADTRLPELAGFTVQPDAFTPNQDGLGDRVTITYRMDEPADVRLTLEDADGNYVQDILEDIDFADPPARPASSSTTSTPVSTPTPRRRPTGFTTSSARPATAPATSSASRCR